MSGFNEYYGVLTYKDPLVFNKIESYSNGLHRDAAYRTDPLLNIYISKLDEEIFTELPIFEPDILGAQDNVETVPAPDIGEGNVHEMGNGSGSGSGSVTPQFDAGDLTLGEAGSEVNEEIVKEWQQEDWSSLLISMFDKARVHRWCIVVLYNQYPYWRIYSGRDIHRLYFDDHGKPEKADIMAFRHLPYASTKVLMIQETVEFGDDQPALFVNYGRPQGRQINSDDIRHIWSLSVQMRYIRNDIIRNSAKSSGFYHIKLGKGAQAKHKSEIHDVLDKANYGNVVAIPQQLVEEINDIHPENAQFSIEAYDKLLKSFAGACRLPLSFFNSETEKGGIGVESKTAEDALVNKKKRFIFGMFKTEILQLVQKRWGVVCDNVYPNIEEQEEEHYREQIVRNMLNPNEKEVTEKE